MKQELALVQMYLTELVSGKSATCPKGLFPGPQGMDCCSWRGPGVGKEPGRKTFGVDDINSGFSVVKLLHRLFPSTS